MSKVFEKNRVHVEVFRDQVGYDVRIGASKGRVDVPFSDVHDLIEVLQGVVRSAESER